MSALINVPEETTDEKLDRLASEVSELSSKMDQFIALANQIKDMVEPTLTSLMDSPIAKMMGVK